MTDTPEPSAEAGYTEGYVDGIRDALAEPSAEADAAWRALRNDTVRSGGLPHVIDRHRPLIEAALSRPATPPLDLECLECGGRIDYVKGRPATPPLDVERLAERLRDLRSPGTTSNDERYDLGWYDGIGAALAALANPTPGRVEPSAEADAAHPDWRDATPEQWDTARDALNDAAHFDAMLIARYPLQRDNYVAYIVAKAAAESRPATPPLDVERLRAAVADLHRWEWRGDWTSLNDIIARLDAALAIPDPETAS